MVVKVAWSVCVAKPQPLIVNVSAFTPEVCISNVPLRQEASGNPYQLPDAEKEEPEIPMPIIKGLSTLCHGEAEMTKKSWCEALKGLVHSSINNDEAMLYRVAEVIPKKITRRTGVIASDWI